MKLSPFFTLALVCLFAHSLSAQKRTYLDKNFYQVDSTDRYEYYQDATQLQGGQTYLKVFKKNGTPVSQGAYSKDYFTEQLLEEGVHRYFYDNKKPWYQVEFKKGKREGMLASWYPSGASKRIEYFKNDVSTGGECFGEDGQPIAFTPFWQAPQYRKGQEALEKALLENIRYPQTAYEYGIEAEVLVKVVISENGKLWDLSIRNSMASLFFREAKRVVSELEGWKPGKIDDVPKTYFTIVTVPFKLKNHPAKSTLPGSKRFDLIKSFIDSGTRFYIDSERNLVNANQPYVYEGEAKTLPDGRLMITHYDKNGDFAKEGIYTCYARMLENMVPNDSIRRSDQVGSMATNEPVWEVNAAYKSFSQDTTLLSPPEYIGGNLGMSMYLSRSLNYPELARENDIQGVVLVEFVIDKVGNVTNVMLTQEIGGGCGKEAVRVMKNMPPWKPGYYDGKPVKVRYTLPLKFLLE